MDSITSSEEKPNKSNIANTYTTTQVDNLLNNKQNTLADGDLTIAKTNGLQTAGLEK